MQAAVFSALGEPNRLRIVELLRASSFAVGDIADALGIRQPQVSKHLKVLADAGIVRVEPRARRRIYHLQAEPFDGIARWIGSFERSEEHTSELQSLMRTSYAVFCLKKKNKQN